jgi:hypothetical protein
VGTERPSGVSETAGEQAGELRDALLEILRQLNKVEVEGPDVVGLEQRELFTLLRRGPCPYLTEGDLDRAIETLIGNRMAQELDDPEYAWDRGRVVGPRYALTLEGKRFLLDQLERTGRID